MQPHDRTNNFNEPDRQDSESGRPRWAQWPVCPDCGRRRQTRCPTCDLGGDDFSMAEVYFASPRRATPRCSACSPLESCGSPPEEGDDSTVLLMCPDCEEAFAPEFYRLCQHCGHDFGAGLLTETTEADQVTDRALHVLAGLIALVAALLVYFWFVTRA
ncbi:MAG: hypothetical protein KJ000_35280 [Pirellulaceae bacterium]|nr:hypothetical protein [Pirellulaceae bacterium]